MSPQLYFDFYILANGRCQGQKRPFEESGSDSIDRSEHVDLSRHVSHSDYVGIKRKCMELEAKIRELEYQPISTYC